MAAPILDEGSIILNDKTYFELRKIQQASLGNSHVIYNWHNPVYRVLNVADVPELNNHIFLHFFLIYFSNRALIYMFAS